MLQAIFRTGRARGFLEWLAGKVGRSEGRVRDGKQPFEILVPYLS